MNFILLVLLASVVVGAMENYALPEEIVSLNRYTISRCLSEDCVLILYAPWCVHCKDFLDEAVWAVDILKRHKNITVAAADAATDQTLVVRFSLTSYPTVFLTKGGRIYKYPFPDSNRSDELIGACEGNYSTYEEITGFMNPFGFAMTTLAIYAGYVIQILDYLEPYADMLSITKETLLLILTSGIAALSAILAVVTCICTRPKRCSKCEKKNEKEENSSDKEEEEKKSDEEKEPEETPRKPEKNTPKKGNNGSKKGKRKVD